MSIEAVVTRVAQLQQMIGGTQAPGSATFAATLASAAQPATTSGASLASASSPGATAATASMATLAGAGSTAIGSGAASGTAASAGAASGTGLGGATAAAAGSSLPAGTPYGEEITAAAQRNGIDPALLAGLIKQESGFNPSAGSPAGAQGLTQLMPGTARGLGVTNPLDPAQSIEGGAKYLRQQLDTFGGDVARALAAYNAGPGAVQRYGGVPPYAETQSYVRNVQANAASFRTSPSTI